MYGYIMSNRSGMLYVGVTNDIVRRVREHREETPGRFTIRYRLNRLVYVEQTGSIRGALAREKQIKGWTRRKKLALVATLDPGWTVLPASWFDIEASRVPDPAGPDPSLRSR